MVAQGYLDSLYSIAPETFVGKKELMNGNQCGTVASNGTINFQTRQIRVPHKLMPFTKFKRRFCMGLAAFETSLN